MPSRIPEPMINRDRANTQTVKRMFAADPILVGVKPALEVVPDMTPHTILTSGPPTALEDYSGGQRRAILYGAVHEGLAESAEHAETLLAAGDIVVEPCQEHGCIGSVAGIYTASMPVLVVENGRGGNRAFCNLYEGKSPRRLN